MISLLLQWPSVYIYITVGVFSAFSQPKLDEAIRIRSVSNGICSCGKHGSGKWFNLVVQGGYSNMKLSEQNEGSRILLYDRSLLDPGRVVLHFYKALCIRFSCQWPI